LKAPGNDSGRGQVLSTSTDNRRLLITLGIQLWVYSAMVDWGRVSVARVHRRQLTLVDDIRVDGRCLRATLSTDIREYGPSIVVSDV